MRGARFPVLVLSLAVGAAVCVAGAVGGADPGALRVQALAAFARGDYEAMARACEPLAAWVLAQADAAGGDYDRLARLLDEHFDDCLGLGHAHQLAGDWAKAAAAYQKALGLVEASVRRCSLFALARRFYRWVSTYLPKHYGHSKPASKMTASHIPAGKWGEIVLSVSVYR